MRFGIGFYRGHNGLLIKSNLNYALGIINIFLWLCEETISPVQIIAPFPGFGPK